MDLLKEVFKSIRLEGSVFFNSTLTPPWDLELDATRHLRFHLVLDGHTWLKSPSVSRAMSLRRGDAILLNDGARHSLVDSPSATGCAPSPAAQSDSAECRLICGKFEFDGDLRHPLIDTLPPRIHLAVSDDDKSIWSMIQILTDEIREQRTGSTVVVDRICEMLLIHILRSRARQTAERPTFVAALDDSYVCKSLRLIHAHPERDWTLESLAREVGLSRSAFAARFNGKVGMPPKAYLTTWRMHVAERRLRQPTAMIGAVAHSVGYSSDAAFIRAFKQFFGKSPGAFREDIRTG